MFAFDPRGTRTGSLIDAACEREARRQWRNLILIPSESICLPEARAVLASTFTHVYAEGRPDIPLCHDPRGCASQAETLHAWRRRLADGRYYKGCGEADVIELLATRFIAEAWSALKGSPPAQDIAVVVQALSGAAANLAVQTALLEHGDTIMGLDLAHGGHLTHGSEFNFSGKTYRAVSYGVDPTTRRIDYAEVRRLAHEHRPRLIIGGASSYPHDFDWAELRSIADEVGAYLLADVAHLAGMIVAGLLENPLPHAHVVTHTTHKTILGPRGAVILTADRELGQAFGQAVFPGLQGGPHVQSMAAIGRAFEAINHDRETFVAIQKAILENTAHFADCLKYEGFALEYGGTSTHMLLVDLKLLAVPGDPEVPLDGEIASRLLELAGIVVNKNVLPGDQTGGKASGIRMGMPWLTQRGVTKEQIKELASIIRQLLSQVHTCSVWVPPGERRCRGRIDPRVLEEARERVKGIVDALPYPPGPPAATTVIVETPRTVAGRRALVLRGEKVALALEALLTCRVTGREDDSLPIHGLLLRSDGSLIDDVVARPLHPENREERWLLLVNQGRAEAVQDWLSGLSDGYLLFDPEDLQAKIDGPMLIENAPDALIHGQVRGGTEGLEALEVSDGLDAYRKHRELFDLTKPYFVGQQALLKGLDAREKPCPLPSYERTLPRLGVRRTVLNPVHRELGAKMTEFAGWEMPLEYPAGFFAEHRAVRTAAGLFDVSHMSTFEVAGPDALHFLEGALANCVSRLDPGEAQYTCILDPNGVALDDLFLYRIERDRFFIVSNAANAERVLDWLGELQSGSHLIDRENPAARLANRVTLRDLRDAGADALVGLALQGPASRRLLAGLCGGPREAALVMRLGLHHMTQVTLAGVTARVARTGYTGEKYGYELYVHPDRARQVWEAILEAGESAGVLPAGLAARDSTRIEAGLPLFGHELEGEGGLSPTEAGYGFIVRLHVPFFVGRRPYVARARRSRRHLLRLRGAGRRSVRPGHVIVDEEDRQVGVVSSFSFLTAEFDFAALAWVEESFDPHPGKDVRAVRIPQGRYTPPAKPSAVVHLSVVSRFPDDGERAGWPQKYL